MNVWDVGTEYQAALVQAHFDGDQRKLVSMLVQLSTETP